MEWTIEEMKPRGQANQPEHPSCSSVLFSKILLHRAPQLIGLFVFTAVFARVLLPGVELEDFIAAWKPEGNEPYPARLEIGIDPSNDRRVITIIQFDGTREEFNAVAPRLIHPQSLERIAKFIESTELASFYTSYTGPGAAQ